MLTKSQPVQNNELPPVLASCAMLFPPTGRLESDDTILDYQPPRSRCEQWPAVGSTPCPTTHSYWTRTCPAGGPPPILLNDRVLKGLLVIFSIIWESFAVEHSHFLTL
jgi:hypothetical protein